MMKTGQLSPHMNKGDPEIRVGYFFYVEFFIPGTGRCLPTLYVLCIRVVSGALHQRGPAGGLGSIIITTEALHRFRGSAFRRFVKRENGLWVVASASFEPASLFWLQRAMEAFFFFFSFSCWAFVLCSLLAEVMISRERWAAFYLFCMARYIRAWHIFSSQHTRLVLLVFVHSSRHRRQQLRLR
ncbi:hypothetical protein LZ32DRAFT_232590 [Colletotrichum eremochloae]|nr:hypothetical protein LZ32DRAFT_232590 [Colletotrichum eremochloae]